MDLTELTSILKTLDPAMDRDGWLRVLWGAAAQWAGTKMEDKVIEALDEAHRVAERAGHRAVRELHAVDPDHVGRAPVEPQRQGCGSLREPEPHPCVRGR